jgi:hypothetical protein
VKARENRQNLLIFPQVLPSLMGENSLVSNPTELQYSELTLIYTVSARTHVSSTLLRNTSCNALLEHRSTYIHEMFMLCLLQKLNACL